MSRWVLWSVLLIAWTIALEVPVPLPEEPGGSEQRITPRRIVAKTVHVVAYAVLTVIGTWNAAVRQRWLVVIGLMLHAAATEWLQEALSAYFGRGGSFGDVGLDLIGIALGIAVSWMSWSRG